MWPLHIKFKPCFHINTRWLVDGNAFFFFFAQIREKSNGNDSQGCCGSGERADGPGKLKHVSKIRKKKKKKPALPQTGRHVNVAEPLRWVHYGPSRAAFSHQKSHQCIKRYSLGTDKLILSSSLIWIAAEVGDGDSILSFVFPQQKNILQEKKKKEVIYCNTIVFSKSVKLTDIFMITSEEMENVFACFIQSVSIFNINKLCMFADNQHQNVSYLLFDIHVVLVESMNNISSVYIWEWAET